MPHSQTKNVPSPFIGLFEHFEYAAPLVAVKKKNGRVRVCANYSTGLNESLEPNQYPLPVYEEVFDIVAPFKLFSNVDLSDVFLKFGKFR